MSKRLTADKAFGESLSFESSKVVPSKGQLEGQEKTQQEVLTFLQDMFPGEEITPKTFNRYYTQYLQSIGVR